MIIKQLSAFLEDKINRVTAMTKVLADNNINILALNIADAADYGIVRLIVDNPELALKVLKENRFSINITDVVGIIVPHESGGLYKALKILSAHNIAIDYMYSFALYNAATVVIRSSSAEDVVKILQEHNIQLIKESDIYKV